MPTATTASPKTKRLPTTKKTATVNASKITKSKANPKATFPNLPGSAGQTSTPTNPPSDAASISPPPIKNTKTTGPTKNANTKGKGKAPVAKASKKRKTDHEEDTSGAEDNASEEPRAKRPRTGKDGDKKVVKETKAKPAAKPKPKLVINYAPTDRLNVYVFGEGSSGELGLGTAKNAIDVKRPRLNLQLSAQTVGVVQIACGGMHVAALTYDGKVLTWGVNDQGALGRDTNWEGGLRDVGESDNESDSGSDSGLNPFESTPTPIATLPKDTVVVKLSAGDSHTLALTDEGLVYGWGTFRVSR